MKPFQIQDDADALRILFGPRFVRTDTAAFWDEIDDSVRGTSRERVELDFTACTRYDSSTVVLAAALRTQCEQRGISCELHTPSGNFDELLSAASAQPPDLRTRTTAPASDRRYPTRIGDAAVRLAESVYRALVFTGESAAALAEVLRHPGRTRWGETWRILQGAGADALPIVALICFLMGVIMAFQAAVQLHTFGADIYVADLVALSIVRELGPLMTAIICAGRSGAGFAAELGAMKVGEEVDAMVTMGLDVQRFLVTPKILALLAALPCLTVLGNLIAILGGMLISATVLGLPCAVYWNETVAALGYSDFFGGLAKSFVFAALIAGIGCYRGLEVGTDAQDVGRKTTSAVVTGIFFIILADAGFSVLYHVMGI
ncbi:MAG: ABC transporter permease [Kiritimatiellaeota bacterium]|nr:ABC transporter permease [Kiritimatiellota bacterium]